jgi:hypothetical protein
MKTIAESTRITLCGLILTSIATMASASSVAAQTVVVGTGDPNIDVPAVQYAVDQGGEVILKGHFSFDRPPTQPMLFAPYMATIRVSNQVVISGTSDDHGGTRDKQDGMTSIASGTVPFYVEAFGARVEILGLRFIQPKAEAIAVSAVSGLVIASCKIEGVEPLDGGSDGIGIYTTFAPPTPTHPGKPENISGTLLITNNDIDMAGGTALDNTGGIIVLSVGQTAENGADVYVSGNSIRNTTEPAISFHRVGGRAHVEDNVLVTDVVSADQRAPGPEVIRVFNTGSYVIARNRIDCRWAAPNAKGIGVASQFAVWPIERAIVADNDVIMSPPPDMVFGDFSAGINIRAFAQGNVVTNNRIRGRARAALSVERNANAGANPDSNEFLLNRVGLFEASDADIVVGDAVTNTRIVGQGTVDDHGIGTVIVLLARLHGRW